MFAETRRSKYLLYERCTFLLVSWRSSCREKERDRSWEMFPLEVIKWLITTGVEPPPPSPYLPPPTYSRGDDITWELPPAIMRLSPSRCVPLGIIPRSTLARCWLGDQRLLHCGLGSITELIVHYKYVSTVSIRSWNIIIIIISSTITGLWSGPHLPSQLDNEKKF